MLDTIIMLEVDRNFLGLFIIFKGFVYLRDRGAV